MARRTEPDASVDRESSEGRPDLFDKQALSGKRLLNSALSASSWKSGALAAEFRQPFDMLMDAKAKAEEKVTIEAVSGDKKAASEPCNRNKGWGEPAAAPKKKIGSHL